MLLVVGFPVPVMLREVLLLPLLVVPDVAWWLLLLTLEAVEAVPDVDVFLPDSEDMFDKLLTSCIRNFSLSELML